MSFIVQFQFYESLCKTSGEYVEGDPASNPLYLCDFSKGGLDTGATIRFGTFIFGPPLLFSLGRNMMAGGLSVPWQEAFESFTGSPEMSASSFIKYFSPLYDFLEQENEANALCIGWAGRKCIISL